MPVDAHNLLTRLRVIISLHPFVPGFGNRGITPAENFAAPGTCIRPWTALRDMRSGPVETRIRPAVTTTAYTTEPPKGVQVTAPELIEGPCSQHADSDTVEHLETG